jgi:hypothetical protein
MSETQGYLFDTNIVLAAAACVTGLKLLSMDGTAFLPLRGTEWAEVVVLDPKTGIIVP